MRRRHLKVFFRRRTNEKRCINRAASFWIFFGAGNLIFHNLGYQSAEQFWPAVISCVSGVGLAVGTLLVGTVINGGFKKGIGRKIHPIFSLAF